MKEQKTTEFHCLPMRICRQKISKMHQGEELPKKKDIVHCVRRLYFFGVRDEVCKLFFGKSYNIAR